MTNDAFLPRKPCPEQFAGHTAAPLSASIRDEQFVELECEELVQSLWPLASVEHTEGQLPPMVERHLHDDVVEVSP